MRVLDSNVGLKTVLPETDSDKAIALRDAYLAGTEELIAPDIYPIECGHVLSKAERQGILKPPDGSTKLLQILATMPQLQPSLSLLARAFEISSNTRTGVYDCLYIALAEREGCELVTADQRMINAHQRQFPFIIPLSSL